MASAPQSLPLFYNSLEPLSSEQHGNFRIRPSNGAPFLANQHAIPLTVDEFPMAQRNMPIVFSQGDDGVPLALMGLNEGVNVFIDEKGQLREPYTYVPAYIRRYPFVLANDQSNEQLVVCIDRDAAAVQENGEVPLFINGEPSPFTQQAIEFCTNFESERQRTLSFVQILKDLDLFELKEQFFTPQNPDGTTGEPVRLADFYAVSEEKLGALPIEKLAELRDTGALQQIYIHLNSLLNWDKLVSKTMQKDAKVPSAANN